MGVSTALLGEESVVLGACPRLFCVGTDHDPEYRPWPGIQRFAGVPTMARSTNGGLEYRRWVWAPTRCRNPNDGLCVPSMDCAYHLPESLVV